MGTADTIVLSILTWMNAMDEAVHFLVTAMFNTQRNLQVEGQL